MFKFSNIIVFILYPFIIVYWIIRVRGLEVPHIIFYFVITWQIIETILLLAEEVKGLEKNEAKIHNPSKNLANNRLNKWWIHLIFQFLLLISYYYLGK